MLIITGGLPHCRVRLTRDSSCFLVSLTSRKAVFVVEKRVSCPEILPRSGGVGASRQDKRNEKLGSLSLAAYRTVGRGQRAIHRAP